jgi:ABC-type cobalamin/Fe3+-siderophores transport system ATPase subunit
MGNTTKEIKKQPNEDNSKFLFTSVLTRNSYDFLYVIGKGGFGKVSKHLNLGMESVIQKKQEILCLKRDVKSEDRRKEESKLSQVRKRTSFKNQTSVEKFLK